MVAGSPLKRRGYQILASLNKPEDYLLAVVLVKPENNDGGQSPEIHYIRQPFYKELDFGVVSVNFSIDELLKRSGNAVHNK